MVLQLPSPQNKTSGNWNQLRTTAYDEYTGHTIDHQLKSCATSTNTPSMTERLQSLQLKYVYRISYQPDDTLVYGLTRLMDPPRVKKGIWHKLQQQPLVTHVPADDDAHVDIKRMIKQYRQEAFNNQRLTLTLLQQCRPQLSIDPIIILPMHSKVRSCCIRWRLGWLTGGTPKPCCCGSTITKSHVIQCRQMHSRLSQIHTASDPLSFLLNKHQPPRTQIDHQKMEKIMANANDDPT